MGTKAGPMCSEATPSSSADTTLVVKLSKTAVWDRNTKKELALMVKYGGQILT
jgi:hypothetical protein